MPAMDTATSYLGFRLPHPFMAGASPFGHHLDTVRRLEDAGCAAIVLHSLFEEQLTAREGGRIRHMDPADAALAATMARFPEGEEYPLGPDAYAEHIRRVKQAVNIPVIGSLNGISPESWLRFARIIEHAGADALELNLYEVITDVGTPAVAVESQFAGIVREVKRIINIPVAVKVLPYFTSFGNMARQFDAAGADGLVLFNRFYQADIDIRSLRTTAHVELSTSSELLLRLHWLAILHGRIRPSLAITGGVNTPEDGIKALLAGADAVQTGVGSASSRIHIRANDAPGFGRLDGAPRVSQRGRLPGASQPAAGTRSRVGGTRRLHPNTAKLGTQAPVESRLLIPDPRSRIPDHRYIRERYGDDVDSRTATDDAQRADDPFARSASERDRGSDSSSWSLVIVHIDAVSIIWGVNTGRTVANSNSYAAAGVHAGGPPRRSMTRHAEPS